MTRIIAGSARGRRLVVPVKGTRPTSDRVRESLFSTLTSALLAAGTHWSAVRVLDLYAGSGALGLEAASRGAAGVLLVEKGRLALDAIRANVAAVGLPQVRLLPIGVELLPQREPPAAFDLVLADPPYDLASERLAALLEDLAERAWIAPGARIVVERAAQDAASPLPTAWEQFDQRRYGDTALWYGRSTPTTGE